MFGIRLITRKEIKGFKRYQPDLKAALKAQGLSKRQIRKRMRAERNTLPPEYLDL